VLLGAAQRARAQSHNERRQNLVDSYGRWSIVGREMPHITKTYAPGKVARALGIPVRRLEGWGARGLVTPNKQRGRTRHGDRRLYDFRDVMTVAVLAELQKLLGSSTFQPGGVARLVAEQMNHASPAVGSVADAVLVLSAAHGKPTVEIHYRTALSHIPLTAVVIKLTTLATMVARALEDA
jgi:DNA-binding transcriptional MerR regulator